MGLLDKAKQLGQQAAEAAKKGTTQVQGKIEQAQTKKKADELAEQLGYLIVRERTQGATVQGDVDRLVGEITSLQAQIAEAQAEAPAAPDSPGSTEGGST
jgi:septal ring factor EnvC (AmiA/AmiB activator)